MGTVSAGKTDTPSRTAFRASATVKYSRSDILFSKLAIFIYQLGGEQKVA
jgi:hypothetical protein